MGDRRRRWALAGLIILALAVGTGVSPRPVTKAASLIDWGNDERETGYYTIVDENGAILLTTGLKVTVGDRFIAADNKEYEVYAVEGDTARARPASGEAGLAPLPAPAAAGPRAGLSDLVDWVFGTKPAAAPGSQTVAIYHTHSDESYVPSDGAASIPAHGGIFQVGAAFRDALKRKGLNAVQSTQPHDPHDNLAYDRSRRTAMDLLTKNRPAAIFDVHRDTAPAQDYEKTVSGQKVTQVMFVVGRQNPNMQANLAFAKDLKAAADKTHPGLVRAIYFGQGRYNQDLSPRAMLIEVGAQSNTKPEAEKGITLLADDVPKVIGTAGPSGTIGLTQSSGTTRALITIVSGILLLGAGYLVIASGGFRPAWERLRRLPSTELAGYLKDREESGMSEEDVKKGKRSASKDAVREEESPGSRTGGHEDRQLDERTHHQEEP